jgi:hypothetical protein
MELHSGVNASRRRYPDQYLIKYAEIGQVEDDAEKLRQIELWLKSLLTRSTIRRSERLKRKAQALEPLCLGLPSVSAAHLPNGQ